MRLLVRLGRVRSYSNTNELAPWYTSSECIRFTSKQLLNSAIASLTQITTVHTAAVHPMLQSLSLTLATNVHSNKCIDNFNKDYTFLLRTSAGIIRQHHPCAS